MYKKVISVTPQKGYKVSLTFADREVRILDISPYLDFGIFSKLKNIDEFNSVRVAFGTIEWSCGADLDPQFVYNKSVRSSL